MCPEIVSGSLLVTRRSAIGQFFPSLITVPKVFAKVNSPQFCSRFLGPVHMGVGDPRSDPPRRGNLPVHIISYITNSIAFT